MINTEEIVTKFIMHVPNAFKFLCADAYKYKKMEPRHMNEKSRDEQIVFRFEGTSASVDVALGVADKSIGVMVRLERSDVSSKFRFIHLEPFVLFDSNGKESTIIPQIYYGMSERKIIDAMEQRELLIQSENIEPLLSKIGLKLSRYLDKIILLESNRIMEYAQWYAKEAAKCSARA